MTVRLEFRRFSEHWVPKNFHNDKYSTDKWLRFTICPSQTSQDAAEEAQAGQNNAQVLIDGAEMDYKIEIRPCRQKAAMPQSALQATENHAPGTPGIVVLPPQR